MWQDDNIKNFPYLLVNSITDSNGNSLPSPPLSYTKSPEIPQAMAALLQLTEQDMADILGSSQQADKMVSNISGKAVELIQTRLDMQTYIYMSNMAKAVKRSAEIWLSQAMDLYPGDDDRSMKTLGPQGEVGSVEMLHPILDEETGEVRNENDISRASLDVSVEVGPSSVSRREATVRSLTSMIGMATDPETQQVLQSMAMMNMEGEGVSEVREFFRKRLVKMGALKPTKEDAEELAATMQAQEEDPNATYLKAAAENESAKAIKAKADALAAVAKAQETQAKTAETLAGMDIKEQQHALTMAKDLDEALSGNLEAAPTSPESEGIEQ